jgi:predicted acylesterase/phospholipase RssA
LEAKNLSVNLSLLEFYNYNKIDFHFICTELNRFSIEDISHKTHPDMKLVDAIYSSCSVPVFFAPHFHKNLTDSESSVKVFLDGGVFSNYPLNRCTMCDYDPDEIFGVYKASTTNNTSNNNNTDPDRMSLLDYIFRIIKKLLSHIEEPIPTDKCNHQLPVDFEISVININDLLKIGTSPDERRRLIHIGKKMAVQFLEEYSL